MDETPIPARGPDPRALVAARRAQAAVGSGQVILFGSRARGDWHRDSDIDLMVIEDQLSDSRRRELTNLRVPLAAAAADLYPDRDPDWDPVPVQLLYLTRSEFERARRAPTHLAGGVQRDGLTPDGKALPPVVQDDPWPAVQNFLQRSFVSLAHALQHEGNESHLDAALNAFHAFELTLKAYASSVGYAKDDIRFHNLNRLIGWIRHHDQGVNFTHTDADWCKDMQEIRREGPYTNNLDLFREADDILDTVQQVGGASVDRALQLMGRPPADVGYTYTGNASGFPDIDHSRPWGGLEDAEPYRFSNAYRDAQVRAETLVEAVLSLHSTEDANRLLERLENTPPEDWPAIGDILNTATRG